MKKKRQQLSEQKCLCGSSNTYAQCCMHWHQGENHLQAPDAESLMRSRYTAYALKLYPYILNTWHPDTRPEALDAESTQKWIGLTIHSHQQQDDAHATVEFTARYTMGGKAQRMHETSTFEKVDNRWYYKDGDVQ